MEQACCKTAKASWYSASLFDMSSRKTATRAMTVLLNHNNAPSEAFRPWWLLRLALSYLNKCIWDLGRCFGTNDHPRRDTDMRIRQKTIPFQFSINLYGLEVDLNDPRYVYEEKYFKPCFFMIEHPRGDTDVRI